MAALVNLGYRVNLYLHDHASLHRDFLICSLGNPFPEANVADPQDEQAIVRLMRLLETRIQRRDLLQEDVREKRMIPDVSFNV